VHAIDAQCCVSCNCLGYIIVRGGAAGVEFAGTLADFVRVDLRRKYAELMPSVRVTLLQACPDLSRIVWLDLRRAPRLLPTTAQAGEAPSYLAACIC
jgi:NADH dehydrogenase FAD-containing subunit